jgi:hypothetical protein
MNKIIRQISPLPPPSPPDENRTQIQAKAVEILSKGGYNISTSMATVEVLEMSKVFSVYLVKGSYKQ